jgi:predicted transcriptional regulator
MKQILISIKPKWVAKILRGEKTSEIRKTAPKEWVDYLNRKTDKPKPEPTIVNIYCTKGDYIGYLPKRYVGKVVAKFVLDKVRPDYWSNALSGSCLSYYEVKEYVKESHFFSWQISNLEIFDEPKELSEFSVTKKYKSCDKCPHHGYDESFERCATCEEQVPMKRAPQSWCYVEELL